MRLLNKIFRPYKYCREYVKRYQRAYEANREELIRLRMDHNPYMKAQNDFLADELLKFEGVKDELNELKERHINLLASFEILKNKEERITLKYD
jgi:hypothetical protein